ncbi:hypothetical protein BJY01DRAFT_220158 [Aspergillus pseudoustus]|uniref:F-box domain-containing protein n=1 Tax=Aspergillus pseudoustus TaxID=1810923 RepID=A0ABR4JER5_9EURO
MVHEPSLARPKSPLESLPTEIIQEIFLRCLEVNLPRASLHIARALSDPVIYSWLIRLAFSVAKAAEDDGDDEDEREPFITRHFLPPHAIVGYVQPAEMKELRTRILGCRWCTLPAIRNCQIKFLSHVSRYIRQDIQIYTDDWHMFNQTVVEREFEKIYAHGKAIDGEPGNADLTVRANKLFKPPTSNPDFMVGIWFNLGLVTIDVRPGVQYPGHRHFELPSCEDTLLPRKLLGPPWTETKLEFLQLLSTKAILDEDETCSRATRTIRGVIRDRDFPTFMRLLDVWVRVGQGKNPIRFPTRNPVFKAALKYAEGYDDPFVRVLVEDRWTHIDPDDLRLKEQLLSAVSTDYPPI